LFFGKIITAMVTPFNNRREVDYKTAERLADKLVKEGSDAILVSGTTGESPALSTEEKISLCKSVLNAVGDRAKVIAGTGSYSTEASIDLTKKAQKVGVHGIMLVTPYYNKPPQKSLELHFKAVTQETELPVMLYNVPGRTSRNLETETVLKLAEIDNICALKEASGDLKQITEIAGSTPENFIIYSGDDAFTLPILAVGGSGVVSVASHLVGKKIKEMIEAFNMGDVKLASNINDQLYPLFNILFITTNPIPVKTALNIAGIDVGPLRLPLSDMDDEDKKKLINVLQKYELL